MSNGKTKEQEKPPTLKFSYKRSRDFRVIKVDGAWGGLTPRGDIVMSVFNERLPIPESDEYEISEEGTLGKRINQVTNTTGIIREVEAAISLRPEVALTLGNWLLNKVEQFEKAFGVKFEQNEEGEINLGQANPKGDNNE